MQSNPKPLILMCLTALKVTRRIRKEVASIVKWLVHIGGDVHADLKLGNMNEQKV